MSTRTKIVVLLFLVVAIGVGAIVNRGEGGGETAAPTVPSGDFTEPCSREELELLEPDVLTIGAALPSALPWLAAGEPAPQGFEPGIALAVAEFLLFAPGEVRWVDVTREDVLASGPQGVDFVLGQLEPTIELDETMDFTEWYYDVEQAVLVREQSELADGVTLAELQGTLVGAPAGPSHDAVLAAIQPTGEVPVYADVDEAVTALKDGDVDAVLVEYPTALELLDTGATGIVAAGRLPAQGDVGWGIATPEGSSLRACLSAAIANVRQQSFDLELAQEWIEPGAPPLIVE